MSSELKKFDNNKKRTEEFPRKPVLEVVLKLGVAASLGLAVYTNASKAKFLGVLVTSTVITGLLFSGIHKLADWFYDMAYKRMVLGSSKVADVTKRAIYKYKFGHQLSQFVHHAVSGGMSTYLVYSQEWGMNFEKAWPIGFLNLVNPDSVKYYYSFELGVWMYMMISHLWFPRRRDYYQMLLHHVLTTVLIGWSSYINCYRMGLVILSIHHLSDIPTDFSIICNQFKLEGKRHFFLNEIAFIFNILNWTVFRCILYPSIVLYSSWLPCFQVSFWELIPNKLMCLMLVALAGLHYFWWLMFIKMFIAILKGDNESSSRKYEGASDSEDDKKHKS